MIVLEIPGRPRLELAHLLLDLNGTLAVDGRVSGEVAQRIRELAGRLEVSILTADTFGTAQEAEKLGVRVRILEAGDQAEAKARAVRECGPGRTAALGNGRNDEAMLREAALGIAVLGSEGAAPGTLLAADVVVASAADGLDLLRLPRRLAATLRNR